MFKTAMSKMNVDVKRMPLGQLSNAQVSVRFREGGYTCVDPRRKLAAVLWNRPQRQRYGISVFRAQLSLTSSIVDSCRRRRCRCRSSAGTPSWKSSRTRSRCPAGAGPRCCRRYPPSSTRYGLRSAPLHSTPRPCSSVESRLATWGLRGCRSPLRFCARRLRVERCGVRLEPAGT